MYAIKNIKVKLIHEGRYSPLVTEGKRYNSPWNIAADFTVDMSFNADEIGSMLIAYEGDHHTGMDIPAISGGYTRVQRRVSFSGVPDLSTDR